ncbi:hypothetical protein [Stenotrophomonas indicatrix]|uniref:hypothetical protein n=1 Tax=Stenotrophomonas indicatrix TaxID=2045451 RepID=UPI00066A1A59|nr:hypothetical protein [Stenotrophomonas indicatrix]MCR8716835.1 hypothetical protein [Stenotrophomonas indicatrix]
MHSQLSPTCHDAIALRAGALGSVLGVALFKAFALSAAAAGSMMTVALWMLGCALLAAWALAACLTCLALSRRVFVLMLALSTVFLICIA